MVSVSLRGKAGVQVGSDPACLREGECAHCPGAL